MALVHLIDPRRPRGSYLRGGREDGTGYRHQLVQIPVICALDIYEYSPTQGFTPPVTDKPGLASCPDCKERL